MTINLRVPRSPQSSKEEPEPGPEVGGRPGPGAGRQWGGKWGEGRTPGARASHGSRTTCGRQGSGPQLLLESGACPPLPGVLGGRPPHRILHPHTAAGCARAPGPTPCSPGGRRRRKSGAMGGAAGSQNHRSIHLRKRSENPKKKKNHDKTMCKGGGAPPTPEGAGGRQPAGRQRVQSTETTWKKEPKTKIKEKMGGAGAGRKIKAEIWKYL